MLCRSETRWSASAVADSKQTLICTYLSGVLLAGLAVNALFGWSWADPAAALVIAAAVREGRQAWRGDTCCTPPAAAATAGPGRAGDGCTACGPGCACS
jgi:hypothetical protein